MWGLLFGVKNVYYTSAYIYDNQKQSQSSKESFYIK